MDANDQRIVIVGAGLAGAATAFHLRQLGARNLVILEKEPVPGAHSSGRNAAMIREAMEEPELQALSTESTAALRTGELASMNRTGGLLMGMGDEDASRWIPFLQGRARFCEGDGVIDVAGLLNAYLRSVEIRHGCELTAFEPAPVSGLTIHTSAGPLSADVLVNAAGPWAGQVGDVDLTATRRHLYTSAHDGDVDPTWPWVWDPAGGYYFRPESGGWLLCACDEAPAAPGDYNDDPDVLADLWRKIARHQPGLGEPRIAHHWVGQRTFARDRLPVIGFDARYPQVFHVAGLGGHGVTLSWSVGALAASLLLGRRDAPPVFAPARLGSV